jgi:hypothetical protein
MLLSDLANQVVRAAPSGMLTEQMLYASLDFRGTQNEHLAIPPWHDDPDFKVPGMARHEFLTGQEELRGEVLIFHYCAHDGKMILQDVANLADAEAVVLGGAGVFNAYTDLLIIFEKGCIRPYRVSYRNKDGVRVGLNRSSWKPIEEKPFLDRQIEWLERIAA